MPSYLVIASRSVKQQLFVRVEAKNFDEAESKAKLHSEDAGNWETETDVGAWISWTIVHADKAEQALETSKRTPRRSIRSEVAETSNGNGE
jgi:predicted transcriptional regulator